MDLPNDPVVNIPRRTAVYRIFGEEDELLYIGAGYDSGKRWRDHAKKQPWWPEARWQETEWYETRELARAVEEAAIKTERPKYNKQHSESREAPKDPQPSIELERAVSCQIRSLRTVRGWSQLDLSKRMVLRGWPWHAQTVQKIEADNRHVRIGELVDLGAIFGVPAEFFLVGSGAEDAIAARTALERVLREEIAAEIVAGFRPVPNFITEVDAPQAGAA